MRFAFSLLLLLVLSLAVAAQPSKPGEIIRVYNGYLKAEAAQGAVISPSAAVGESTLSSYLPPRSAPSVNCAPSRKAYLNNLIAEAAAAADVDAFLLCALVRVESGFREDAVSSAGAIGLTQLIPSTAAGSCRLSKQELFDARKNLLCGARYLRSKLGQFNGNLRLALAAYNCGSGCVRSRLRSGLPLPGETQKYIPAVAANYRNYARANAARAAHIV